MKTFDEIRNEIRALLQEADEEPDWVIKEIILFPIVAEVAMEKERYLYPKDPDRCRAALRFAEDVANTIRQTEESR